MRCSEVIKKEPADLPNSQAGRGLLIAVTNCILMWVKEPYS